MGFWMGIESYMSLIWKEHEIDVLEKRVCEEGEVVGTLP